MIWRFLRLFCIIFSCVLPIAGSHASEFVGSGSCAVIVASRDNLTETRNLIFANGWQGSARVFLSDNGWYAISVGEVRSEAAQQFLVSGKQSGVLPEDSYCSTGKRYVREVAWAQRENAQPGGSGLWSEFDARPLTTSEKVFIQSSLALQGDYRGLLDGAWGTGSQRALEQFSQRTFQRDPLNADAAYLSMLMFVAIDEEGWRRQTINRLAISMVLPMRAMQRIPEEGTHEYWEHTSKDIGLYYADFDSVNMRNLHTNFASDPDLIEPAYTVRNEGLWVTSGRLGGSTYYARSDLISGTWSTVTIVAGQGHRGDLALISGSIEPNDRGLFLPEEGGVLVQLTTALLDFMDQGAEDEAEAPSSASSKTLPPQSKPEENTTGTGFLINRDGVYLTNAHVVDGCSSLLVGKQEGTVVAVSNSFDLAAVQVGGESLDDPLIFSRTDPRLNSDITIAGFPLHGLLGGLNVTRGSISAMKGIGGDETTVQISSPVQPGNSGGPVIDRRGNVVGVVVAKLDAVEVASVTGDISQNVNFAIRGSIAKIFLQTNGIDYSTGDNADDLPPEDAAGILQTATKLIECQRP